ncbi:hypothetical protein BGZ51_002732 [Haplosporangium sp. Z 767]|nr:hypothetical protein BGZ50_004273 [Haplosporangium sp. Z 11]KAF9185308.1 hypothetical protein BGZ51_002732 [Haplosporangium sp. Z 767]
MFGENNSSHPGRGPIALSDDDLIGATGVEWEDLEAQFQGENGDDEADIAIARPLKSMSKQGRYTDDIVEEEDANKGTAGSGLLPRKSIDSDEMPRSRDALGTQKDSVFSLEDTGDG